MLSLKSFINQALKNRVAIGHFNISELTAFKAIAEAARDLSKDRNIEIPVIIGTSEGEREFIDLHDAVALVKDLRENHGQPVFLNADHTHSFDKVKEAVEAGYDAILFDGGKLPLEENIKKAKEVVEYVKSRNPKILVEGELGYIGGGSTILKEIPQGAAIEEKDLTKPEEAARFVKETGVDLLAPAVGNLHGMFASAPNPNLNINRIKEIKEALRQAPSVAKAMAGRHGKSVPLVLHGGSGTSDKDFLAAIDAGVGIIHISTELRAAWRRGLESSLKENPEEVTPYKLMKPSLDEMKKVVYDRLVLFNKLMVTDK